MCITGKRAYYSRAEAKKKAKDMSRRTGERVIPYRCDVCPDWHIGKPPPGLIRGEVSRSEIHQHRYDRARALGYEQ
ncbi:hypothetical protein ASG73_04415 [Janibacter sp. Soil728]|uniref:hypothetical protein n=1 Tax=Janibacter sp. Soil728 TaxID=1736393 RepID=UPI0006F8155B|nr:hypothetical protein [Janibacter sp. Soil728]KRE38212.1 hypothetical protein ASG73_04415 [Janibacter sp. Soil728]